MTAPEERGISAFRLLRNSNLQMIYSSSFLMVMGTSIIYPILPVIHDSLHVSKAQIGLVLSAFSFPAIFMTPLAGVFADLRGRKSILVAGLLIYGAAGLCISLVKDFTWLLVLRGIQGVGYSGVMPLVVVLIGDSFTKDMETAAQGMKIFNDRIAELCLPPLSAALALIAWQIPFLLYALAIPVGLCTLRWLPEPAMARHIRTAPYLRDVLVLAARHRCALIFSMSSLRFFLEYAFFTYLPIFALYALGMTVTKGSFLFTMYAAAAMLTASQMKYFIGRWERINLVILSFFVQALSLLAIPAARGFWTLAGILFFFGLANGVISPIQKSLLTQSAPGELRGGLVSVDRVLQTIAKTVAPPIAGVILTVGSIQIVFFTLGAIVLAWVISASFLQMRGFFRQPVQG
jgi:MFS transporter, ACDE family, multidrug resistance protein